MNKEMALRLIPRVRVNYSFYDIVRALLFPSKNHTYRNACENYFQEYYGREVYLTASGRGAIFQILKSLPQQKVVIPAYNCIAVVEACLLAGKEVIYAHCSRVSFNMEDLPPIDNNTIVIVAHQYGYPCTHIERIAGICKDCGAVLIEDCAAALGTTLDGKRVGVFGDFAIFSFNASKLVQLPSMGGLIVAKDSTSLEQIKGLGVMKEVGIWYKMKQICRGFAFCLLKYPYLYRLYHWIVLDMTHQYQRRGHDSVKNNPDEAYTSPFAEWQAYILFKQLCRLEQIIEHSKKVYAYYDKNIHNSLIEKPRAVKDAVCCRYPIYVKEKHAFYHECVKRGVDLDFSHTVLTCPDCYIDERKMADEVLNIPLYYDLSDQDMERVVNIVNSIQ